MANNDSNAKERGGSGEENPSAPRIKDFELLKRIGGGSYGEVWLARNQTDSYCAIKIVYRKSFDDDQPFEREFKGIKQFWPISRGHDSQVDILHVGRDEANEYFYYVMELADDQDTGQKIDPEKYKPRTLRSEIYHRRKLPPDECLRIGLALTTALEHLHSHGLVHRDIKPSNIIFANGVPKLADIGLITAADATRSFVGTLGYFPPEGTGTPQADLFSLGKVLYEIATSRDRADFPELPTDLKDWPDKKLLVRLNDIWTKACHTESSQRYHSAREMYGELMQLQAGEPLSREQPRKRQHALKWASAGIGCVGIACFGLWFFLNPHLEVVSSFSPPNLTNWSSVLVRDADGEKGDDLFVTTTNRFFIYKGNGTGKGKLLLEWSPPFPDSPLEPGNTAAMDVDGDGVYEAFVSWGQGASLMMAILDRHGNTLKTFKTEIRLPDPQNLKRTSSLHAQKILTIRDGLKERRVLLAFLQSNFRDCPRGLCCFDFDSEKHLWTYPTGPAPKDLEVLDINEDGLDDYVFGSYAPCNGNSVVDGSSDTNSYVFAVSHCGELIWKKPLGGEFSQSHVQVVDIDGNGQKAILAWVNTVNWRDNTEIQGFGLVAKISFEGVIAPTKHLGVAIQNCLPANLDRLGKMKVYCTDTDGHLHVLNADLTPHDNTVLVPRKGKADRSELSIVGLAKLRAGKDFQIVFSSTQYFNGPRENEVVVKPTDWKYEGKRNDNTILVLDSKLKLLARFTVGKNWPSEVSWNVKVADVDGNGLDEILSMTDHVEVLKLRP